MTENLVQEPANASESPTSTTGADMTGNSATEPLNRPDGAPFQPEALVTAEPSAATSNSLDSRDEWDKCMDSEELDGFRPVREELEILARHWAEKDFNFDLFIYVYEQGITGSLHREKMYYLLRLGRIAKVIGKDAVKSIYTEIEAKERKEIREQYKSRFVQGTEDELKVLREEVELEMKRRNRL
jgi:hypothetical protein